MTQSEKKITRENCLDILKQFAREYRKVYGKTPGEIIIVGGGSIMLNYRFRDATQDFDVILKTVSGINDVIKKFADENGLPRDWMNTDFMKTKSYSNRLVEISRHYYTLNNGTLEIRTVSGIYLIAMKIRAHRDFRNDISDVIGILIEEAERGNRYSFADLKNAYERLYCEIIEEEIAERIQAYFDKTPEELRELYERQKHSESDIGEIILNYINDGANINTRNVEDVIAKIKEKMN